MNQYLAAVRVDEFKYIITAELEEGFFKRGYTGGFSGPIETETGGGVMVNRYTDPQEDVSAGIRHIPMALPVGTALAEYMLELGSYPPHFTVGFMSNNPALYDIVAQMKQYLRMRWFFKSGPATR